MEERRNKEFTLHSLVSPCTTKHEFTPAEFNPKLKYVCLDSCYSECVQWSVTPASLGSLLQCRITAGTALKSAFYSTPQVIRLNNKV